VHFQKVQAYLGEPGNQERRIHLASRAAQHPDGGRLCVRLRCEGGWRQSRARLGQHGGQSQLGALHARVAAVARQHMRQRCGCAAAGGLDVSGWEEERGGV
jgi:hypothetical protein